MNSRSIKQSIILLIWFNSSLKAEPTIKKSLSACSLLIGLYLSQKSDTMRSDVHSEIDDQIQSIQHYYNQNTMQNNRFVQALIHYKQQNPEKWNSILFHKLLGTAFLSLASVFGTEIIFEKPSYTLPLICAVATSIGSTELLRATLHDQTFDSYLMLYNGAVIGATSILWTSLRTLIL